MNKERPFWLLLFVLFFLGSLGFWYRWQVLHFPLSAHSQTDQWTVEIGAYMNGDVDRPLKTTLAIPMLKQPYFDITEEQGFAPGFSDTYIDQRQRLISFAKRRASGDQQAYFRLVIEPKASPTWHADDFTAAKPLVKLNPMQLEAAHLLAQQARMRSADSVTYAAELIKLLNQVDLPEVKALGIPPGNSLQRAKIAQTILYLPHISANVIQGTYLDHKIEYQHPLVLFPWLVIFDGQQWHFINPDNGIIGLPHQTLIWKLANVPLMQVDGGTRESVMISVVHHLTDTLSLALRNEHRDLGWFTFSLYQLPLETQNVFFMLFSVPCGIMVVLILRSFIGLPTFGTFLPVLLAMAFRQTGVISGVIMFTMVVMIGLLLRFYLEKLQLLLIPRLGAVLTLVILLMAIISIISQRLGLGYGVSIGLFPIVIFTMTIERMSLLWEEQSGWQALKILFNSLLASALVYAVIHHYSVQHFFFTFPETMLWCIAIMLVMGRYRGYRLSEIIRFQALIHHD